MVSNLVWNYKQLTRLSENAVKRRTLPKGAGNLVDTTSVEERYNIFKDI